MKYFVEKGPLYCARDAGHLKVGLHAREYNQGTDDADDRANGITKSSRAVLPLPAMQQIVGVKGSSIGRRSASQCRVPCLDPWAACATLDGFLLGEVVQSS